MIFEIITIFPDFFRGPLDYGILRRARESGLVRVSVHDLRAFARDRHRTVDDRPFGGGEGMVLKPEPLFECVESLQIAPRKARTAPVSCCENAPAPDFEMETAAGPVRLADFAGKTLVLYFYPKDDTTGCTREAQDFTALAPEFAKAGATVIGVSKDSVKKNP